MPDDTDGAESEDELGERAASVDIVSELRSALETVNNLGRGQPRGKGAGEKEGKRSRPTFIFSARRNAR